MKELLTMAIVNYNSSDFIDNNLYCLNQLTYNYPLKVLICDCSNRYFEQRRLEKIMDKYWILDIELFVKKDTRHGSIGHTEALNFLLDKIETPYGVMLDADCIFLKRGWDQILINQLNDRIKIAGTPPVKNPYKPYDFPLMYGCLFDTKVFNSLNIDMRPKDISKGQDSGWEMREKFLAASYGGFCLDARSTRTYKDGPFGNIPGCDEYYFNNEIFACHFGRGSNRAHVISKDIKIPLVRHIIGKVVGRKQKREWIDICRRLVGDQE